MASIQLPDGYGWTWAGDTVRINLPPVVRTATHVMEPVLSRADAELLAEALGAYERRRLASAGRGTSARPLARILLAHHPQYTPETLAKFRTKLSLALVERGQKPTIDEMVTMSGLDADPPV